VTTVAVLLAGAAFLVLARRPQPRASAAHLTDDEYAGTAKDRRR